jgi:hypothetical protein
MVEAEASLLAGILLQADNAVENNFIISAI